MVEKIHQCYFGDDGSVYVAGANSLGGLGNNTTKDVSKFQKLSKTLISDVIDISSGDNYTVFLKKDGTVWATGDYNQGNENLKSRTKGIIPKLVGVDETNFAKTEILVHVEETKDIKTEIAYSFNLIKAVDEFANDLSYDSINDDIATVSEDGEITGVKTGKTWVKVIKRRKYIHIKSKCCRKRIYSISKNRFWKRLYSSNKGRWKHMDIWL